MFVTMFMSLFFSVDLGPDYGQGDGGGVLRGLRGALDDGVHDSVGASFRPGSLSHYADARLPTPSRTGGPGYAGGRPARHRPRCFSTCIHGGELISAREVGTAHPYAWWPGAGIAHALHGSPLLGDLHATAHCGRLSGAGGQRRHEAGAQSHRVDESPGVALATLREAQHVHACGCTCLHVHRHVCACRVLQRGACVLPRVLG